jgi:hypothetical protein
MSGLGAVLFFAGCCGLMLAFYSATLKEWDTSRRDLSGEAVTAFWSLALIVAGFFA